jgi:DNA topoisomerase-1
MRGRVERDLSATDHDREKVLAAVVSLLESTHVRVGNEEYARDNQSYGLTTLREHHVEIRGTTLRFRFRGKSGKEHRVKLTDARLAKIVKKCMDLPGYELFQYLDENGEAHAIDSADVNEYLREISGEEFTAKHFRTWAGTVQAARLLRECGTRETKKETKSCLVKVVAEVAERLGNTPAVCRKCYVDPLVMKSYLDGSLIPELEEIERHGVPQKRGLTADERLTLAYLRKHFENGRTSVNGSRRRSRAPVSRRLETTDHRRRATA